MRTKQPKSAGKTNGSPVVQRRALLQGAAALACGAAAPQVVSGARAAPARVQTSPSAAPLIARDGHAVAATQSGRVEIGRASCRERV